MPRKILFIDDELDFLEIMKERIEAWGYEVTPVSEGREAIRLLKEEQPDIIILDYLMPDINGIQVLKEIRRENKNIPVIMFTAHPDSKAIKGTEDLGVSAFIPKLSAYSDVQFSLKATLSMLQRQLEKDKR